MRLDRMIAERFGRKHCTLTGHGSTAIYLAIKAIEAMKGKGEVLVSSVGCASIAQIIIYAGFTPRFVDINLADYTLDLDALEAAITSSARAIMPVHLFGHACDMRRITHLAKCHSLPIIEDAAQSIGGEFEGKKLGAIGDFGVFSFAGTKIISAGGGGALLFDDDEAAEIIRHELEALPMYEHSPRVALKLLSHRNLYHGAVDLLRADPDARLQNVFRAAMESYRELYFHRFPEDGVAQRIIDGLESLEATLAARLERAERYHEGLAFLPVSQTKNWRASRSVWRYTFLLRDSETTIRVTAELRRKGIHASNHYWSLADLFGQGVGSLPNTRSFSGRVLNLWVDEAATNEYIAKTCRVIEETL